MIALHDGSNGSLDESTHQRQCAPDDKLCDLGVFIFSLDPGRAFSMLKFRRKAQATSL